MNTNRQIILDNTIIKWLASLLNLLVVLAGKVAPKNHDLSLPFKTIAVCKFKGLGSIVQSTSLLHSLRAQYPDARIIFVSTVSNTALLQQVDIIDEVVLLNDRTMSKLVSGFFPFVLKLFRKRIDVYIDLEVYSNFSSVVAALTNAQNRFGYYLKESNYRMGIYTHMMYYNSAVPIYQTYLQWARLLPCREVKTELYKFPSRISAITIDGEAFDLEGREYFVINPNASDLRIERRWPAASYILLLRQLASKFPDVTLLLIGAPSERAYVAGIAAEAGDVPVINIAGTTSVEELIGVIQHARIMITNDTGPMHLAFAMKLPTVALFGPCSPVQYGIPDRAHIIYKGVYCSPCVHEFRIPPCMGNNQCMQQIAVAEVMSAVEQLLAGSTPAAPVDTERNLVMRGLNNEVLGVISRTTY